MTDVSPSAAAAPAYRHQLEESQVHQFWRTYRSLATQLALFLAVGGSGVILNSALLYLLYQRAGFPLIVASVIATESAIVSNFLLNNRLTFRCRDLAWRRFATFNLISLGGLGITTATLWLLVHHTALHYLLANVVGIALATFWNFGLNRTFTWREATA